MKSRKNRKVWAALLASVLALQSGAMAGELPESAAAQISSAAMLAEQDLSGNSDSIRILLGQALDQLDGAESAAATLQSVILLLDSGTADSASVTVLLRSIVGSNGTEAAPEQTQTEQAQSEQAQTEQVQTEQAQTELAQSETAADSGETGAGESLAPENAMGSETEPGGTEAAEGSGWETGTDAGAETETVAQAVTEALVSEFGLPIYEVSSFIKTIMPDSVLLNVPGDWGNNASGRALTSYSPVNGSGAISPAAGTLTLSYFPMEGTDVEAAFDTYEKNIADMSVTTDLSSQDATAAELPARKIEFVMSVGANQFTCETVCFAYDQTIYAIELMQGQQTAYDYFPAYHQVVESAQIGSQEEISQISALIEAGQQVTEAPATETTEPMTEQPSQTETSGQTEAPVQPESPETPTQPESTEPMTELPSQTEPIGQPEWPEQSEPTASTEPATELPGQTEISGQTEAPAQTETDAQTGDIGTFRYELNGQTYQFPTAVRDFAQGALPLDLQVTLPYDFSSDADMAGGRWTEIVNTQYYYFQNALHKEMAGVTNMSGYPIPLSEGILTALIDTEGDYVKITLPGGIQVGSAESDILKGFPEFAGMPMDGTAAFRGNELLYACNVRDDGCNGYVLIRNDAPYYSAVSIICEYGVIKEISFECLGSVRAEGVFL